MWTMSDQTQSDVLFLESHKFSTPPKFNMEPEYDGFQDELPFLGASFQVPC